jgi:hypothetical protein
LIQVSLLANILMEIYLLWKGSWDTMTRVIKLGLNAFSIIILALLVTGHNTWLAARTSTGFLAGIEAIEAGSWELVGMHAFRLAFVVALVVTIIEVFASVYQLVRSRMTSDVSAKDYVLKVE